MMSLDITINLCRLFVLSEGHWIWCGIPAPHHHALYRSGNYFNQGIFAPNERRIEFAKTGGKKQYRILICVLMKYLLFFWISHSGVFRSRRTHKNNTIIDVNTSQAAKSRNKPHCVVFSWSTTTISLHTNNHWLIYFSKWSCFQRLKFHPKQQLHSYLPFTATSTSSNSTGQGDVVPAQLLVNHLA